MALGTFVAGGYSMTWNGNSIGLANTDGIMVNDTPIKEIVKASLYGENLIDKIYLGRKVTVMVKLIEWTSNVRTLINPYGTIGTAGQYSVTDTDYAKALVCTPLAGTTAAGATSFATMTFHSTIASDDNNIEWALKAGLREIPILFDCYYVDVAGTKKFYTFS
jgi:hypothetical protein